MKFKKNNSSEIFLYSFYFLSVISLLSGIYFNIFIFIRLGFSLYLFGVIFANKGTIYYDEKILILGFFKINIDNISDVEIKNRKVIIKYNNGLERKMWFFFKSNAKNLFNFLKNSELA
ncbi:hypothetical protein [Streptobacillus ratti]|uniref:hypothetical protein n=1 Tax=Streptobacillus ratti TaxID=1720557 RepID=UPI001FC9DFDF|nr:hypothetical protein [Streptobacillus ratti]